MVCFLGISVFRSPASFLICCSTEIHLGESIRISRWWPHSMDMSSLFWHFCGIWIPDYGKLTQASNGASSPATLPAIATQEPGHCCCWPSDYSCPLAAPQQWGSFSCLPASKGVGGEQYPVFPNFSFSLFIPSLYALWMLLSHEMPSSFSF